jgi:2-keto-3-deoxy-6-phosphogluconate aldolase
MFILHGHSVPWFHVIGLGGIKVRLRNLHVIKGILISFGCIPTRGYNESNLKRWFKLVTKQVLEVEWQ